MHGDISGRFFFFFFFLFCFLMCKQTLLKHSYHPKKKCFVRIMLTISGKLSPLRNILSLKGYCFLFIIFGTVQESCEGFFFVNTLFCVPPYGANFFLLMLINRHMAITFSLSLSLYLSFYVHTTPMICGARYRFYCSDAKKKNPGQIGGQTLSR